MTDENFMNKKIPFAMFRVVLVVIVSSILLAGCAPGDHASRSKTGRPAISSITYHGWTNALLLSSDRVEAIIVPGIGRVMQFRFGGEEDGPFWENRAMDGKSPNPASPEWGNFGGDKSWPSPQSEWPKVTPRAWPPPQAFDSMPVTATVAGRKVTLTSAVDPHFGIRTTREIELVRGKPTMRIITTYEKIKGPARKAGVWIITQLREPAGVFVPLPSDHRFLEGYDLQSKSAPPSLRVSGNWVSLKRDRKTAFKIGTEANTLIWVGEKYSLRIDSIRQPHKEYPDHGSSAEVYTNPDPLPYVELEMLGPLHDLNVGDRISQTNTYTLFRRVENDPGKEAHRIAPIRAPFGSQKFPD